MIRYLTLYIVLIGTFLIHRHTEKSALGSTIVILRWGMMGRRCSPFGLHRTNMAWKGGKGGRGSISLNATLRMTDGLELSNGMKRSPITMRNTIL